MMNNELDFERYQRQVILKEFGETAQKKLLGARVLVTGAGGLGCPALLYLAAGGVGTLGIVDDDTVSLSNLHRQVLFTTDDIGKSKSETAARRLRELNPGIHIIAIDKRITNQNALEIIGDYDIVMDGTDNFATRYMINDACVLLNKPLVFGAVSKFEGQLAVFNYAADKSPVPVNYRDLFPEPPDAGEVPNCAEAGVLGVMTGIIGSMMANETIKIVSGTGITLSGKLLTYNTLNNQVYEVEIQARKNTRLLIPADPATFKRTDYEWLCSASTYRELEIDAKRFDSLLKHGDLTIVDIREPGELPEAADLDCIKVPQSELMQKIDSFDRNTVVILCQSGQRSLKAAGDLKNIFGDSKNVYSLKGGILNWRDYVSKRS